MTLIAVTLLLPYAPLVSALGFVPLPLPIVAAVVLIACGYMAATALAKHWFYRARPAV